MSAEDTLFSSLRRHSRMRVDILAEDLASHELALSNVHCSLRALEAGQSVLRRRALTLEESFHFSAPREPCPAAREMSASWIAEEERVAKQTNESAQSRSATDSPAKPGIEQCDVLRGSSLAARRRQRYRSLPGTVRRVAANSADDLPGVEAGEVVEQPMEGERDAENDDTMDKRLLQFRRVRVRGIAYSTAEYLQREAASRAASLLCRAVTTAEQEQRTKQRARVWRQDVGKLKARHVRALYSIDEVRGEYPVLQEAAGEHLVTLLGHDHSSQEGVYDDDIAQQDILADRVYEALLTEKLAS